MSVFDGYEMQKYFLLLTREAEKAAYQLMVQSLPSGVAYEDFVAEIKNMPLLKEMIQQMILTSISNVNWQTILEKVIENNKQIRYTN